MYKIYILWKSGSTEELVATEQEAWSKVAEALEQGAIKADFKKVGT